MRRIRFGLTQPECFRPLYPWISPPASSSSTTIPALTADFLTGHGYVVDTASDAATMRAAMAAAEYDLVVLDVMMPGEDGLTILRGLDPATVTDANCQVTSNTIFPAAYSGR